MTHATRPAPRPAARPAAALAALLLAGCSSGFVGETWQCPLAEGGSCDSVAAADPAVPAPKAAGEAALAEPLWRVGNAGSSPARGPGQVIPEGTACAADCDGGFDPFTWLARLFVGGDAGSEARPPGSAAGTGGAEDDAGPVTGETAQARAGTAPEIAASPAAPAGTESRAADPVAAPLPAPGSGPGQAPGPSQDERDAGDLRTGEVVARIWIAPFVDGNGVYREASYIRVVLEPAGWRLP